MPRVDFHASKVEMRAVRPQQASRTAPAGEPICLAASCMGASGASYAAELKALTVATTFSSKASTLRGSQQPERSWVGEQERTCGRELKQESEG